MQAVKAYYDEGKFIPFKPIDIPKGSHVIVTILDSTFEETQPKNVTSLASEDEMQMRKDWLNSLKQAGELAKDDPLIDFPVRQLMREPHGIAD